jgi:hypothetical protein
MKTLYESILSSTNTGKTAITKEKIEKWIDTNIPYLKNAYEINKDLQICSKYSIRIPEGLTEIPKYIKFGDVKELVLNCDINILTEEQFPTNMNQFLISGRANNIIDINFPLKINTRLSFSAFPHLVKEIKNLEVEFPDTTNRHFIDLDTTNIEIKDIKNINAKNITNLYIRDTPAAKKIMRNVNKFIKDKDNDKMNAYLNDIFGHMPNIKNVVTSQRTILRNTEFNWFKL